MSTRVAYKYSLNALLVGLLGYSPPYFPSERALLNSHTRTNTQMIQKNILITIMLTEVSGEG